MAERYVGIDLNDKYAMISYYMEGMSEPGTFSMVTGNEVYQIPVCISKRKETSQWIYGEEARRRAKEDKSLCIDGLLKKALADDTAELSGTVYDVKELLFLFLKKLLSLPPQSGGLWPDKLVIVTESMNLECRKLFRQFAKWADIAKDRIMLLDYRESFYYYALNQEPELCRNDIALYYYTTGKLLFWRLKSDRQTVPQVVTIEEKRYEAMLREKDEEFTEIVEASFSKKRISCVYLIGDGFDGGWMKKSLSAVCRGRRAFMGKNLFSKGACYGAAVKTGKKNWPYVYMGDNELKVNVSLKVENHGKDEFVTLVAAGENWYEAGRECEVILNGSPSVDFWFQEPRSSEAAVHSVELSGLPEQKDRTVRLRIAAKPAAPDKILFRITDMGFGEIFKASEKVWEYEILV